MTMTERSIQRGLMAHFGSSFQCACPNFTPARWWECDLWAVTKAGYVVEYEIKLSITDFHADRGKSRTIYTEVDGCMDWAHKSKHDLLAAGDCVPSRFFYVVPIDIAETIDRRLPPWAGLIKCISHGWAEPRIVKPAPRLHGRKVEDGQIAHAMKATYHRYWQAIQTIEDLHSQLKLSRASA